VTADACLLVLDELASEYDRKGELHDARVIRRAMARLERRLGVRVPLTQEVVDSARMPLDPPGPPGGR
jgi:hypothetical protein